MTNPIKTCPQVKQREESAGLGIEEHDRAKGQESWWYNSFEAALRSVKAGAVGDSDSDSEKKAKKKYVCGFVCVYLFRVQG